MTQIVQAYNGKINKWVKMKTLPNGLMKIISVKKQNGHIPYEGIRRI